MLLVLFIISIFNSYHGPLYGSLNLESEVSIYARAQNCRWRVGSPPIAGLCQQQQQHLTGHCQPMSRAITGPTYPTPEEADGDSKVSYIHGGRAESHRGSWDKLEQAGKISRDNTEWSDSQDKAGVWGNSRVPRMLRGGGALCHGGMGGPHKASLEHCSQGGHTEC